MSQLGKYLRVTASGFAHFCPACQSGHAFAVTLPNHSGARWTFDGDAERPTFTPSMHIHSPEVTWAAGRRTLAFCCHYHIRAGFIEYLGDCTHSMAGQRVPLPELPLQMQDRYRGVEDDSE